MEKDLGHHFITSSSSHLFNKTDFKQYLLNIINNCGIADLKKNCRTQDCKFFGSFWELTPQRAVPNFRPTLEFITCYTLRCVGLMDRHSMKLNIKRNFTKNVQIKVKEQRQKKYAVFRKRKHFFIIFGTLTKKRTGSNLTAFYGVLFLQLRSQTGASNQGCGSGSGESGEFSWKRKLEAVKRYRLNRCLIDHH